MSTKEYGCFFCSGKSDQYGGTCPNCGAPIDISTDLLSLSLEDMQGLEVIGRGFYGWTLKMEDALPQTFAVKIIPAHRVKVGRNPLQEPRALVQCSPHRNLARFVRVLRPTITLRDRAVPVICMVFDYIPDAMPLRKLIEAPPLDLSRSDIVGLLSGVAWGLARMHSRGLWHNDLHDDNILVRKVPADEGLAHRFESVLIDFGSSRPLVLDKPEEHDRADYYYLGKHVYGLLDALQRVRFPKLTQVDRTLVSTLRRVAHRLMDHDVSRRVEQPEQVAREIDESLAECSTGHARLAFDEMLARNRVSLSQPLANSNALTLKPQDVALLFRDKLRWTAQVEKSETVVIVGPRGCGKTMLLRHLSVESQAWPRHVETTAAAVEKRLREMPFLAFLVSCIDIRPPFLRSGYKHLQATSPSKAEDFCREYMNAQFVLEVARSMVWLSLEKMANISETDLRPLAKTIDNLLCIAAGGGVNLGADIRDAVDRLEKRILDLSSLADPQHYAPTDYCRADALLVLTRALRSIQWIGSKEVYFLLDDYSVTVLQEFVQRAYNPVLFNPSSEVRVKLSSEGDGPELTDTLDRKYRESREFTKVNLGEVYFQASEDEGRLFIEDILRARCEETAHGSLDQLKTLLGEHPHEKQFGSYICEVATHGLSGKSSGRAGDARFFGFSLICRLCSGDISYVIELLRALLGDDWESIRTPLTDAEQDFVIKRFARDQLSDLKRTPPHGDHLHSFALRIGGLLKEYLLASASKSAKDERLRVEIEGAGNLSPQALAIHRELLRHSVLIDGGYGKSRRGEPTRKLFVRRLLAPCFPFSPNRKGCIAVTVATYEQWLLDPNEIGRNKKKYDTWGDEDGGLFT